MANDFQPERLSDFDAAENPTDFEPFDFRERWEDVEGYEGFYQVSNFGRVRSCERDVVYKDGRVFHRKGKLLASGSHPDGYKTVLLCRDGTRHYCTVHRLVACAFLPNPQHLAIVNHKDGNKRNNLVLNLEWCTSEHNNREAFRLGLNKLRMRQTL